MNRLLAVLALVALPSCSTGSPKDAAPGAGVRPGFHFKPGDKLKMSTRGDFDFKERAVGEDRDGLYMSGRLSFTVEIEILEPEKEGFAARLTPRTFDYLSGSDALEFKEGKLTRSEEAEKDDLTLPTQSFEIKVTNEGLLAIARVNREFTDLMFVGPVPAQPDSLLGWLGSLPAVDLREGATWTAAPHVMLAHDDAMPMNVVVKRIKREEDEWSVGFLVGVDKTSDRYAWLKTCVETGTGSLELDARGRPVRAAVSWEAKTPGGQPIGEYQWTCEFSR